MKHNASPRLLGRSSPTERFHARRYAPMMSPAIGFCLGLVASSAYLLFGGPYFVIIPRWAVVV